MHSTTQSHLKILPLGKPFRAKLLSRIHVGQPLRPDRRASIAARQGVATGNNEGAATSSTTSVAATVVAPRRGPSFGRGEGGDAGVAGASQ